LISWEISNRKRKEETREASTVRGGRRLAPALIYRTRRTRETISVDHAKMEPSRIKVVPPEMQVTSGQKEGRGGDGIIIV
jgi:hypothetical protein